MGENELKSAIKINEIRLTASYGTLLLVLYGIYQTIQKDFTLLVLLCILCLVLLLISVEAEKLILGFARRIDELEKWVTPQSSE